MSQYKNAGIVERRHYFGWCNREEISHVCTGCLAVVPEPEVGCKHCKRKMETKQDRLQKFLAAKKEEETYDDLI